jgi:hypothetical protein
MALRKEADARKAGQSRNQHMLKKSGKAHV